MKSKFITLLITGLFVGMFVVSAQKMTKGYQAYNAGEYENAINYFKDEYNKTRDKIEKAKIVYLIAECFRKTNNSSSAAIWYRKAVVKGYPNPDIYLQLGRMLMMEEKYDEAILEFQKYKELVPVDFRGDIGVKSCTQAKKWLETPTPYVVENMKFFNTKEIEFSPCYADEFYSKIYFTSSRSDATGTNIHGATNESFADIFVTSSDRKGSWSQPLPVMGDVNTEVEEGTPSITSDFKTMYYARCKKESNVNSGCELIEATTAGSDTWTSSKVIKVSRDTIGVAYPCISPDGLTLYFASDMKGGYGDLDIWKLVRATTYDEWGEPINMGPDINTPDKETAPFMHPDGTFYFSSNGHIGLGGLDIYKVTTQSDGTLLVENMRSPINSSQNDFGIIIEKNNERGYITSSRGKRVNYDIYAFMLPPMKFEVSGRVYDNNSEEYLADVTVKVISSDGMTFETKTDNEGKFKFLLKPNTDYLFLAIKEGYLNTKERETTKGLGQSKEFKTNISLSPITKPIELPNIYYDFNRWDLRPESMAALDILVETLNDNPTITIELMSHTDFRGDEAWNTELSQKRAQSVVNYLISKGIAKDRLSAKGYGEKNPRVVDLKNAKEFDWMKEGTVLNEEYAKTVTDSVQLEIIHQLNRRTEFKVLRTDYIPKGEAKEQPKAQSQPAQQPQVQPKTHPQVKTETQPEVKLEEQPVELPEEQPKAHTEIQPEGKPEKQPVELQEEQPEAQQEVQPVELQEGQLEDLFEEQSVESQEAKTEVQPEVQSEEQPAEQMEEQNENLDSYEGKSPEQLQEELKKMLKK